MSDDLDAILKHTRSLWEEFRNKHIFITGGTGFFGYWLLESFSHANHALQLNAHVTVLTRNANTFKEKFPVLANQPFIHYHEGDIRTFEFPAISFNYIIHAGNSTHPDIDEKEQLSTIVDGTERTLDLAKQCEASKFLLVSSGAVYGKQPLTVSHLQEDMPFVRSEKESAYIKGKRLAEKLAEEYADHFSIKIARCFAFVGPLLPLDSHFAIGNFIQAFLQNQPVHVKNANTWRSYLYAADLMIWLWTILVRGESLRPYNVGSDKAINMAELAKLVSPTGSISINLGEESRYIPDITRAQTELGLDVSVDLATGIQKTIDFKKSPYSR